MLPGGRVLWGCPGGRLWRSHGGLSRLPGVQMGPLGPSWVMLGPSWAMLGVLLGFPWAHLGSSWASLLPYWAILGSSWAILGSILVHLGPILGHRELSWAILGLPWTILGPQTGPEGSPGKAPQGPPVIEVPETATESLRKLLQGPGCSPRRPPGTIRHPSSDSGVVQDGVGLWSIQGCFCL